MRIRPVIFITRFYTILNMTFYIRPRAYSELEIFYETRICIIVITITS